MRSKSASAVSDKNHFRFEVVDVLPCFLKETGVRLFSDVDFVVVSRDSRLVICYLLPLVSLGTDEGFDVLFFKRSIVYRYILPVICIRFIFVLFIQ